MITAVPLQRRSLVDASRPGALYQTFHEHFEVVAATTIENLYAAHALRYQVYCVEHPFEDPSQHGAGLEIDEFDHRSVHSLIYPRGSDQCAATVRLVLNKEHNAADTPFPLESQCGGQITPEAVNRLRGIDRTCVAEISRFAVSKAFKRRVQEAAATSGASAQATYTDQKVRALHRGNRAAPHITLGLFAAIVRMSVEHDVTHWLAVMEPTLLRLLERFGIHFPPIGPLVEYHGRRRPTFARAADVVEGIRRQRPEVWEIVTDRGRYLP